MEGGDEIEKEKTTLVDVWCHREIATSLFQANGQRWYETTCCGSEDRSQVGGHLHLTVSLTVRSKVSELFSDYGTVHTNDVYVSLWKDSRTHMLCHVAEQPGARKPPYTVFRLAKCAELSLLVIHLLMELMSCE